MPTFKILKLFSSILLGCLLFVCLPVESKESPVAIDVLNPDRSLDDVLRPYMVGVRHRIQRLWLSAGIPSGLSCKVVFDIGSRGEIYGPSLHTGSGSEPFDSFVMQAVERSAPFPPPPQVKLKLLLSFNGRCVTAEDVSAAKVQTERAELASQKRLENSQAASAPFVPSPTNSTSSAGESFAYADNGFRKNLERVPAPLVNNPDPYSFKGLRPGSTMAETFQQVSNLNYVVRQDDVQGTKFRFTNELRKVTIAGEPIEYGLLTFANGKLSDISLFVKADAWASVSLAMRERLGNPTGPLLSVSTWDNGKTTVRIFRNIQDYCVISYSDNQMRELENVKNASDL